MKRIVWCLLLAAVVLVTACAAATMTPKGDAPVADGKSEGRPREASGGRTALILATTTSTQDSGLLDVLVPLFEERTGYHVKPIAVGSGQAMLMGERGEADVLLVHAPDAERKFMAAGHGAERRLVMHNDFVIVGPDSDPASIRRAKTAREALVRIATSRSLFFSRADNSGTNQLEEKLWLETGITPKGQEWYKQTGQGMGATLNVASEKSGYTITDRGTLLAMRRNMGLQVLVEGDRSLLNVYHVITVNPQKSAQINYEGAKAFADFLVAPETQAAIGQFGVEKFGQPLFFPDAGKGDDDVGR